MRNIHIILLIATLDLMILIMTPFALASQHPSFSQFASPIPDYTMSKSFLSFPTNQSTDTITVSITDSAIYRYVNTSFNGQNWVQRSLQAGQPSSCTTHPDDTGGMWFTGTCTLTVPVTGTDFSFSAPGTSKVRNYITAYSCTENVLDLGIVRFRLGWDCHGTTSVPGMWQIWNFTAGLAQTCGNGTCDSGETCSSCPADCGACQTCGNSVIEGTEQCDCGTNGCTSAELGGATCASRMGAGYTGTLNCTTSCTFNTSLCVASCTPNCAGKACGSDGCGGNCGTCSLGNATPLCNATNQCAVSSCIPGYANCNGRSSDGCETQLGINATCANCTNACPVSQTCTNYVCTTPQSGTCGGATCKTGEYCSNNACLLQVPGHTYFVATNGNDNNPGNFTHPWATWKKGFESVTPGDIVYLRGGVYMPTGAAGNYVSIQNIVGTQSNQLYFFNYPGESPILDGSLLTTSSTGYNTAIDIGYSHWFNFRGLTVRNFRQYDKGPGETHLATAYGGYSCSNFHYENCVAQNIGGRGWYYLSIGDYNGWNEPDNSSWINCDSYNNVDPYSAYLDENGDVVNNAGNAADGFFIQINSNPPGNALIEGCRAWNDSDDGFNLDGDGYIKVKNCWSFSNYHPEVHSNEGNGFKLDTGYPLAANIRTITNCISANNPGISFDTNNADADWPRQELYNLLSFNNSLGLIVQNCEATIIPASANVIRNMISYKYVYAASNLNGAFENVPRLQGRTDYLFTEDHNTWTTFNNYPYWQDNSAYNVTDADFVSLNVSQLANPRKADGSLPDITFGHLAAGSDLINTGIYIPGYHCPTAGAHPGQNCVEWYGSAPDLGAFEYAG
jgi:hypothetical protein